MSASTDRKFAKFLAFGSAMFGCTWAQVLAIGICLLCLCLCLYLRVSVSVNVRMFVLNSQDNLRLLCEATMRGCSSSSSSIRRCLRFAKPAKKKKAEKKEHGMLCGIAWRRILQVSPQLACAVRRSSQKKRQHNNWLINALQVAAKTKLFSARGKTLINASLKSRQTTTRCKRLRAAAGAELFITLGQANTGEAAEGAAVEGVLGQLEESQQTACSQSATKTFAITRGGAEPRPGSEDTGMDTAMDMDMDMEKVDMEQLDIEEEEARLSKGAAQQCQRQQRRRRRQKSQRGQAVKNEL